MANYNQLIVMGNLVDNPEVKIYGQDKKLTKGRIATSRKVNNVEKTMYIDFTAFDWVGETLVKFCKKGSNVFLIGRLEMDSWTDKDTKQLRSRLVMVAENMRLLDKKNSGSTSATTNPSTSGVSKLVEKAAPVVPDKPESPTSNFDDDPGF